MATNPLSHTSFDFMTIQPMASQLMADQIVGIQKKHVAYDIDDQVQDYLISIANALEILQSCIESSIWWTAVHHS